MPFKSKAQRRKFAQLLVEGEITPETYEEWNRETGSATLPERVKKKSTKKRATRKKSAVRRKRAKKPATRRKAARKKSAKRAASKRR